jgi:hypothetical protein
MHPSRREEKRRDEKRREAKKRKESLRRFQIKGNNRTKTRCMILNVMDIFANISFRKNIESPIKLFREFMSP